MAHIHSRTTKLSRFSRGVVGRFRHALTLTSWPTRPKQGSFPPARFAARLHRCLRCCSTNASTRAKTARRCSWAAIEGGPQAKMALIPWDIDECLQGESSTRRRGTWSRPPLARSVRITRSVRINRFANPSRYGYRRVADPPGPRAPATIGAPPRQPANNCLNSLFFLLTRNARIDI